MGSRGAKLARSRRKQEKLERRARAKAEFEERWEQRRVATEQIEAERAVEQEAMTEAGEVLALELAEFEAGLAGVSADLKARMRRMLEEVVPVMRLRLDTASDGLQTALEAVEASREAVASLSEQLEDAEAKQALLTEVVEPEFSVEAATAKPGELEQRIADGAQRLRDQVGLNG